MNQAVEVRRSARRKRTVSAYREGERIVVLMPARTSVAQERQLVNDMVERVLQRERAVLRTGPAAGDTELNSRAMQLSERYLQSRARPVSVRWVRNMSQRWGSCTVTDATIRLSHRLQSMPEWVIDYVLVHELVHLLEPGHGPRFWAWVNRYPRTERACGYLEGLTAATQLPGLSSCSVSAQGSPGSALEADPPAPVEESA